eukprot:CAMPEP_0115708626 /NCGR_PEP_ID=MMETSP0272-20121206/72015_1 /TAXON_ID=71861 /ORGANISM="Scrippsiella trochoidea, Strain CCMP3099" /LENGTH=97 /DNA_ID=CAMNT_0003150135 /DNA_START=65 /DNA_END=355 /DNA_ORIENTATION=+
MQYCQAQASLTFKRSARIAASQGGSREGYTNISVGSLKSTSPFSKALFAKVEKPRPSSAFRIRVSAVSPAPLKASHEARATLADSSSRGRLEQQALP